MCNEKNKHTIYSLWLGGKVIVYFKEYHFLC